MGCSWIENLGLHVVFKYLNVFVHVQVPKNQNACIELIHFKAVI
jgi:hypothetical protein